MSPEKVSQTIKAAPADEPLLQALITILETAWKESVYDAINANLTPDQRSFSCGRASVLRELLDGIDDVRGTTPAGV